jgi:hypothetical protein
MQCYRVNMDNYRCYFPVRVRIFKSSGQDLTREKSILQVHHPVLKMEPLMVAPLVMVTQLMPPSLSIPAWSVGLT